MNSIGRKATSRIAGAWKPDGDGDEPERRGEAVARGGGRHPDHDPRDEAERPALEPLVAGAARLRGRRSRSQCSRHETPLLDGSPGDELRGMVPDWAAACSAVLQAVPGTGRRGGAG